MRTCLHWRITSERRRRYAALSRVVHYRPNTKCRPEQHSMALVGQGGGSAVIAGGSTQSMHITMQQRCDEVCKALCTAECCSALLIDMLFCRRICNSDGSGVRFYLLVDVHEDAEDFEHGTSLNIQATDGQSAWSQKGLCEVQVGGSTRSCLGRS